MGFLPFLVVIAILIFVSCCRKKASMTSQHNYTTTYVMTDEDLMFLTDEDFEQLITDRITAYFQNSANTVPDLHCIEKRLDDFTNQLQETSERKNKAELQLCEDLNHLKCFILKCRRHKSRKHFRSKTCDLLLDVIEESVSSQQPLIFFRLTYMSESYFELFYDFVYDDTVYASLSKEKRDLLNSLMQTLPLSYGSLISCIRAENQITARKERLEKFMYKIKPMLDACNRD